MNKEEKRKQAEQLFLKGYQILESEQEDALVSSRKFLPFLEKSAKDKNPKARFILGYILTVGYKDLPVDISKGNRILKKCFDDLETLSEQNHDYQATKFISEYYRVPLAGHVKDDEKVKRLLALSDSYREAELQGLELKKKERKEQEGNPYHSPAPDTSSYDQLVQIISELKEDGTYDNEERLNIIRSAAEKGNLRALLFLGDSYKEGKIVPKDIDTSNLYYMKAEEIGSVKAKFMLGKEAVEGNYSKQDIIKGLNRIYQSAKEGYPEAQYYLGIIYYQGQYVEKDISKAYIYFQAAYSRGYQEAGEYLHKLEALQGDKALINKDIKN
jgi:TPR repeat protein